MSGGQLLPGVTGNSDSYIHNRSSYSDNNVNAIIVPTVLNFSNEELSFWNNLSFLFNKYWTPEESIQTLPFCFFQITKYAERKTTELSKKRVLVYQQPTSESDTEETITKGAMNVVVDNAVIAPKVYTMEIVLPFLPVGRFLKSKLAVSSLLSDIVSKFKSELGTDTVAFMTAELAKASELITNVRSIQEMQNNNLANIQQAMNMNANNFVNKNSLDAMSNSGRILMFKNWQGQNIQYCMLEDVNISKDGKEDDVFRASLTMSEIPVMSLTPVTGEVTKPSRAWVQGATNLVGELISNKTLGDDMPFYREDEETEDSETS